MAFILYPSRRSTVYSTRGVVAASQTLAAAAGAEILQKGGNAVDAAVAASAALCVTEPGSTGVGGDCFVLFYEKRNKRVHGLDGCGRSARNVCIQDVLDADNGGAPMPRMLPTSTFSVTVPGAVAAWVDAHEKWGSGRILMAEILAPAIRLAEEGFAVGNIAANMWLAATPKLREQNQDLPDLESCPLLVGEYGPVEGELVTNRPLASLFREVARSGKQGFYEGPVAKAIISRTDSKKHKLDLADLQRHRSTFVDPISVTFENHRVWEIPPSGQGLVALLALGIIRELDSSGKTSLHKLEHNSADYLHLLIEATKIGFYDSEKYVTDPDFHDIPLADILDAPYFRQRATLFNLEKALTVQDFEEAEKQSGHQNGQNVAVPESSQSGHKLSDERLDANKSKFLPKSLPNPANKSDTVYLTTADSEGNACSFINLVYAGFGLGIIVPEYGFALQSRGANFNLTPGSPNCLEGAKKPYHTIIPSMITTAQDDLYASFGNMGGYMQPAGHVQHTLNMILFNMSPQDLIDLPRFCLCSHEDTTGDKGRGSDGPVSTPITVVALEDGISDDVSKALAAKGHHVCLVTDYERELFGRAQIIRNESRGERTVWAAGSEMRADGAAVPIV